MKTLWLPLNLSLSVVRSAARPTLLAILLLAGVSVAAAQEGPRIISPQPNQNVHGEIVARFDGIPALGYALIKVNGQVKTATAQNYYSLDTIADTTTFNGNGEYTLEVTALSPKGRILGTTSVQFNVANYRRRETHPERWRLIAAGIGQRTSHSHPYQGKQSKKSRALSGAVTKLAE